MERARVARELARGGGGSAVNRAAALAAQQAALDEDAAAFDYDGVYDQMQQERSAVRQGVKPAEEKKAKYITSIMQAHKGRELENEKLFERKMQKEAEAEAHLYGDKEKFMTSAYRAKLEAREEYEAELKRQEAEEAKNDVTKRGGLGHFYANLLDGRLAGDSSDGPAAARASDARGAEGRSAARGASTEGAASGARGGSSSASVDAATADDAGDHADDDDAAEAAPPPPASGLVTASLADSISQAVSAGFGTKRPAAVEPTATAAANVSHERRNDGEAVQSARERYLARKRQREQEGGMEER